MTYEMLINLAVSGSISVDVFATERLICFNETFTSFRILNKPVAIQSFKSLYKSMNLYQQGPFTMTIIFFMIGFL